MSNAPAKKRQVFRTRNMMQEALKELLSEKPYHRISITEIAERANIARSTFYTHFETKDKLLESFVDSILDEFFEFLYSRDVRHPDRMRDLEINVKFFQIWKSHTDIVELLNSIDIDCLLVSRFKAYWRKHYASQVEPDLPGYSPVLASFLLDFLTYTYVGILRSWFAEKMTQTPETLGRLLYQLTGPPVLNNAMTQLNNQFNSKK